MMDFKLRKLLLILSAVFSVALPALAQKPVWEKEKTTRPKVSQNANASESTGFVLLDGTPVKLKLMRDLSSATDQTGATVDFEVIENVELDEKVIIRQGAVALGTITEAIPKRRMGKTGKLEVRIDNVTLLDGRRVPLRAVNTGIDGSRVGTVTTLTAAAGMIFFPAAPLFLLMKGKDITIPKGTFVTAYINENQLLNPDNFTLSAEREKASVHFQIDVAGAEIWIEEKFVGNAPAVIKLAEGEYQVTVKKNGYREWKKTIAASAGSLMTLTVNLEKLP